MEGQDGADNLTGGLGTDHLEGGAGIDLLNGGPGGNVSDGDDTLIGGEDEDTLEGGSGNDFLYGDEFIADADQDGACDDDTAPFSDPPPPLPAYHPGNDSLTGGDGSHLLVGGAGADDLFGGRDDDRLCGNAGDDKLDGDQPPSTPPPGEVNRPANGDDIVRGGSGSDDAIGGLGNDSVVGGPKRRAIPECASHNTATRLSHIAGSGHGMRTGRTLTDAAQAGRPHTTRSPSGVEEARASHAPRTVLALAPCWRESHSPLPTRMVRGPADCLFAGMTRLRRAVGSTTRTDRGARPALRKEAPRWPFFES